MKFFKEGLNGDTVDKALEMLFKIYSKKYINKTRPYDGIEGLLNLLAEKNIKLAVNSNKKDQYTKNLIYKFFDGIPFIDVYGERENIQIKPDPTTALEIAENMNLKPEEILFIGDSKTDVLTAKNAHMESVGVLWGFRDREELSKYGAKYIVSDWKEILDIVR
ncbi:HAD family hydrolase [Schnuerera ultunensis]|uniref:HAD-superfamily hydrolase, subfamily IA,variant 1 n=2 Tax=Schnuerera ultunensis TaxID=45497 RepID=A0A1M4PJI2_9FIRM